LIRVTVAESKAEREDAFQVRKNVFVEEQGVPLTLELDEHDDNASHFIVYSDEQPIGAGRIREIDRNVGKVERVCVLKEYRGKHLGNMIMLALEEHAKKTGMKKIVLMPNRMLYRFMRNSAISSLPQNSWMPIFRIVRWKRNLPNKERLNCLNSR